MTALARSDPAGGREAEANRHFAVTVEGSGEAFPCLPDERVLIAMEHLGKSFIPVGCRGGGCGTCRVRVTEGRYRLGKMSRAQVTEDEERKGYALACQVYPESDLILRLAPRAGTA